MTITPRIDGGIEHSLGADVGIHLDGPKMCDVSVTRKYKDDTLFWRLYEERIEFNAYSEIIGQGTTSRLTASGVKVYTYERPLGGPGETITETIAGEARDWDHGVAL